MLNKLRNFSKGKLAGVLVGIIIIPFVFWGMGSVFSGGNTNSVAKLNKYNISLPTEKFLRLPIYELTERLIKKFRIPENSYISFFLDVILKFSENKGSNLRRYRSKEDVKDTSAVFRYREVGERKRYGN